MNYKTQRTGEQQNTAFVYIIVRTKNISTIKDPHSLPQLLRKSDHICIIKIIG